jgi:hypothetical protein
MLADVIEIIAAQWDDVLRYLSADDRKRLIALVQEFLAGAGEAARYDAAQEIVDTVAPALPADHPVRRAIASEGTKYAVGQLDWSPAVQTLWTRLETAGPGPFAAGQPGAGPELSQAEPHDIAGEVPERILAAPAVTETQLRDRGVDPNAPGLIRLSRPDGDVRLPAFQFDPGGHPYAVVMRINLLLDADDDPWGVADWWLGPNGWIGAVPAESIGRIDDTLLVAAAQAVYAEG